MFLPEVGDEVLVGFDHGDVDQPYVLGGLYNGVDKPPLQDDLIDGSDGKVNQRGFVSRLGHQLVFLDVRRQVGDRPDQPPRARSRIELKRDDGELHHRLHGKVVIESTRRRRADRPGLARS